MRPLRIATNISDPPPLTDEDYRRISEEGRRASEEFMRRTRDMEVYREPCFRGGRR